MAHKHKMNGVLSLPGGIMIGTVACMLVAALCALVLAYLVARESVGINSMPVAAMIIVVISSAVGALSATALTKQKRLLVYGLTALFFYLVLMSATAVFFDGMYSKMGLTALMVLLGAGGSALFGLRKKSGKSKIKIPAYR